MPRNAIDGQHNVLANIQAVLADADRLLGYQGNGVVPSREHMDNLRRDVKEALTVVDAELDQAAEDMPAPARPRH